MQILYKNEPLTTIYRCDEGGIHLVTHNVNIGIQVSEFCRLHEGSERFLGLRSKSMAFFLHRVVLSNYGRLSKLQ